MKIRFALAGIAALALPAAEAAAQELAKLRIRAGMGAQIRPEFYGADEREWAPYPHLSFATGDKPFGFRAPDDALGIKLFGKGPFGVGPAVALKQGRKDSEAGLPLGKVPTTFEAGAFAEYETDSFRVRAEALKGIGGHGGMVGSLGADYVARDGDRYLFSIGPRLLFSNSRYQREFFGVSDQAALATGLPAYRPDGGLHGIAAASSMHYALGGGWGLFGFARYERLVGDARRSPIVREIGSPNQFSAGIGINHTFSIRL